MTRPGKKNVAIFHSRKQALLSSAKTLASMNDYDMIEDGKR